MTTQIGLRRYLLVDQGVIPFFINLVVNHVIGRLTFGDAANVAVWDAEAGAAADSVGTCFFLPLITCLIATPIVRRQVRSGSAPAVPDNLRQPHPCIFQQRLLLRAMLYGLTGLIVFSGPVVFAYHLSGRDIIPTDTFLVIKPLFAACLGLVVTPLIACAALTERKRD